MRRLATILLVSAAGWLGFRMRAAVSPAAYPYWGRWLLEVPRPWITRRRLLELLAPAAGERILELGPGTGYYTAAVAGRLGAHGRLDVLDVSEHYLDHTMRTVRGAGHANVIPKRAGGESLPYPDASFDAAYLVTVIGEIPDPAAALRELRRVVRAGGRVVFGETLIDPDYPRLRWLTARAREAGLELERRVGSPLGYFARFTPAPAHGPSADSREEAAHAAAG